MLITASSCSLRHRERRALHRRDPLARYRIAEIQRRGDHHAGGAVDLLEQFIVHQHAAIFGGEQIGPSAGRQADFKTAATHFTGYLADGVVFPDFAFFQFGNPNGFHSFGFQYPNVFIADDVSLRQQLFPTRTEDGATEDPSS